MRKMCKPAYRIVPAVYAIFLTAGCVDSDKSSNPLAPSVAGPIPGVTITAPTPITPVQGARVSASDQPILFEVENATSSGVRPLTYRFELSADPEFGTRLHEAQGIAPGEDGRTRYRLTDYLAAERLYYWRVKAEDGANDGPFMPTLQFRVFTPVVFGQPTPVSPTGAISTLQPQFVIGNVTRSGPAGTVVYGIEVADNDSFSPPLVGDWRVFEQAGSQTRLGSPILLPANRQLFWRAWAADETTRGAASGAREFRTPASAPPAPPPPPPGGGGGGSPLDQLDLSQVTWLHQNVSAWPVTSTVTDVTITHDTVCVYHTGAGQFPQSQFGEISVEGNVWIFARINGRWYGATWDWLRVGQVCKGARAEEFGRDQIRISPMDASWVPRAGDQIGFMMSSRARDGVSAGQVRSNVRMVTWPY